MNTLARLSAAALSALALGTLTHNPASAQDPYPPQPMTHPPGAHAGDGRGMASMTLAEFQMRQRNRLMKADTDHDGRISLAEWTAWHQAHPGPNGGRGDPGRMFARLDMNHDGYITPDEIDAMSAKRFAHMDANHDGVVTPDERAALHGGEGEPAQPLTPR